MSALRGVFSASLQISRLVRKIGQLDLSHFVCFAPVVLLKFLKFSVASEKMDVSNVDKPLYATFRMFYIEKFFISVSFAHLRSNSSDRFCLKSRLDIKWYLSHFYAKVEFAVTHLSKV